MTVLAAVALVVAAYLVAGAGIAVATVGKPRRALDAQTSTCLAVARVALAVALLAAVLGVAR